MGSLFLLQGIFPTQELNRDLLHCRQILYQLSHQGSLWFEGRVNMGSLAEVPKEELEELEVTIHKVLCGHETCFWTLRCSHLTLSKSSHDCLGTGVWVPYSIPNCFQLNRIITFTSLSLQDPGLRRQHSENSSKNCKTIYKLQRKKCKYPYWVFVFLAVSRYDSLSLLNTGLYNSLYQQTLSKWMNKWNYCFAVYWTILKLSLLGTKS